MSQCVVECGMPETVSVRLPSALVDQIRRLAGAHTRSIIGELTIAINDYIARQERDE